MTCTLLLVVMVIPGLKGNPAVASPQSALQHLSEERPEVRWISVAVIACSACEDTGWAARPVVL
jgi:hypothetical protein